MAARVETPSVTVPAGTAIAAPLTTALTWNDGTVERIEVFVPPGPSGLVGFQIVHSGQVVIPFRASNWVITDDEKISWDVEGYPVGGKWAVRAYNVDLYDHTLYFRFLLKELGTPAYTTVTPVPIVPLVDQVVTE